MRYLPYTDEDVKTMLERLGHQKLDDLFQIIPEACRFSGELNLSEPLTEWELNDHIDALGKTMCDSSSHSVFLGAGSYHHYIPATVKALISRSEFATAYTPYQPEISQGTLQGIFEYQTLVARLLGMDVSNASLYDGGSALAESLMMAIRITKRKKVAVSSLINPLYRKVVDTYFAPTDWEIIELPYQTDGRTDLTSLGDLDEFAAVALQSPNYFGIIEDLKSAGLKTADQKTLFICGFSEALSYGLLKNPGSFGADIVCGEGQSFGIPQSFGGPGLGMMACKQKYVRSIPGRLVGQTTDLDGKRGFVLTLAAREQHIRREKATSNICSNQALCALAASVYMASVGGSGIKELARLNYDKCEYLKGELVKAGCQITFNGPTFNEFVVEFPTGFETEYQQLLKKGIVAGLPLVGYFPDLNRHYLLCVTETASKEDMDNLVKEII